MDIAQIITGWIILIGGIVLTIVGVFIWPALIYGIPMIIIGVLILVNFGRETEVEGIRGKPETKHIKRSGNRK